MYHKTEYLMIIKNNKIYNISIIELKPEYI